MKHTKSDMCTGTEALDTRNTVQKHQLTSTCLEEMQVMMHVNMALQWLNLQPQMLLFHFCVAKELSIFITTKSTFNG